MADASDSKSDVGNYMRVQVPSPALFYSIAVSFSFVHFLKFSQIWAFLLYKIKTIFTQFSSFVREVHR